MPPAVKSRPPLDEAQRDLVAKHTRFAISVAKKYFRNGDEDDLVAEAYVGLCIAATKFDPERGYTFMTYAHHWVRAMILQHIMRHRGPVRFGARRDDRMVFLRVGKALTTLGVEHWEDSEAMAKHIGVDVEVFRHMRRRLGGHRNDLYLDHAYNQIEDTAECAEQAYGEHEHALYTRALIDQVLDTLEPRSKKILQWLYMRETPYTLQEAGERLGLSRERVRQIKERALVQVKRELARLEYDG